MGSEENFTCIKYLMIAFNFVFWLLGCAIIAVGIWIRVDPQFSQVIDNQDASNILFVAAYVLIAIGALIMIIGFLGCCGAIRESQCLLATFFVFLLIIFVALVAVGVWALVDRATLKDVTTKAMQDAVKNYNKNDASKQFMDNLQTILECCGATKGAADYLPSAAPDSCKAKTATATIWVSSCQDKLFDFFKENLMIIGGVAIGVGCIMMLGMIFSCCMYCAIRRRQ